MIAESCSGGDRPGFEKAVTLQLFVCFGSRSCGGFFVQLNSSIQTVYVYSKLKESQSMFSQRNNICCSSLSCSAESPSVLGHHTVNWVMRDDLITKYCSTNKCALLKPFYCVIAFVSVDLSQKFGLFCQKEKEAYVDIQRVQVRTIPAFTFCVVLNSPVDQNDT